VPSKWRDTFYALTCDTYVRTTLNNKKLIFQGKEISNYPYEDKIHHKTYLKKQVRLGELFITH